LVAYYVAVVCFCLAYFACAVTVAICTEVGRLPDPLSFLEHILKTLD